MRPESPKDRSILDLLARLGNDLPTGSVDITDHWESDLCAIGISAASSRSTLAYVSADRQDPGYYYLELELPPEKPGSKYEVAGRWERIEYKDMLAQIRVHFGIDC